MPVEIYCVESVWRYGEQSVRTHVVETFDKAEALAAGRTMAHGRKRTRVLQVVGDCITGVWSERTIAEFEPTQPVSWEAEQA